MSNLDNPPALDSTSQAKEGEKDRLDRLEETMAGMKNTFAELGNTVRSFMKQQSHGEAPSTDG